MTELGGQILLCRDGQAFVRPGVVRVRDDRIDEVDLARPPESAETSGDPDQLICPGFVDGHLHLPQFPIIGAHGMPLLRWLKEIVFPTEAAWADVGYASEVCHRCVQELFRHGTTSVAAYATIHGDATGAALRIFSREGLGGCIGHVWMTDPDVPELCRPRVQLRDETMRLLQAHPPGGRLAAAVTPRFALSCDEETLRMAGQLASETGAIVQTHLSETEAEVEQVSRRFEGRGYVDVYQRAGLVGPRSIFGHAIHLTVEEQQVLAEARSLIAHCPTANTFLRSGRMSLTSHAAARIPMILGSDIGAGYERSMVRVARAAIENAAALDFNDAWNDGGELSAEAMFHRITAGACEAMGWNDRGKIAVGSVADLLVIRPDIPWRTGSVSPLSRLMWAWDDRWIHHVYAQGRQKI